MILRHALIVPALVLVSFSLVCLTAASDRCRVVTVVVADDIRSRPTYVAISVPSLRPTLELFPGVSNPSKDVLNSTFRTTQGILRLADVSTYVAETTNVSTFELGITLSQMASYSTFTNDMVNLTIPADFFNSSDSSTPCSVSFPVMPSAGTISIDSVATTVFEVEINTGNISFDLTLVNDEFSTIVPIVTPSPLPLGLAPIVMSQRNASTWRFTLLQNETLNINSTANTSYVIVIHFQPNSTRTGISPEVGPLAEDFLELSLSASVPSVRVAYPAAYLDATSVPSEYLWDGNAEVYLDIQGDVWLPNATLWTDAATRPSFAAVPYQDTGFDFLVTTSVLRVNVTGRRATLTWTPCFGFAVASRQAVSVSSWNHLTSENKGDIAFTIAIRPATASSISATFVSGPNLIRVLPNQTNVTDVFVTQTRYENCTNITCTNTIRFRETCTLSGALPWNCTNGTITTTPIVCTNVSNVTRPSSCTNVSTTTSRRENITTTTNNITAYAATTEFVIRKTGIAFNVSLFHDTVSPGLDATTLQDAFQLNTGLSLSLSSVVFTKYNSTYFSIVLSPDLTYNIDSAVVVLISIAPTLLSSQGQMINNIAQLTINAVPTPVCEYPTSSPVISSDTVRQGRTTVEVLVRNDTVCDRSAITTTVLPFVTTTRGLLNISTNATDSNATRMLFYIAQLPSYSISSFDQVYLPMTLYPFCSLEACQAVPLVDSDYPNRVTVSVRPSAGVLFMRMPTVDERVMRVTPLVVNIAIQGDVFTQASFTPTFTVTGSSDDTNRGFVATIRKSCTVTVDTNNASKGVLSCTANTTYDISANETVAITIPRTVMASLEVPSTTATSYQSLVVTPVQGTINANITNVTVVNESTMIAGGFSMTLTLLYERWATASVIASTIRQNYPAVTVNDSAYATVAFLSSFMAATSFTVQDADGTLVVTFPPLPNYDIITNETFFLLFDGACVVSGVAPIANNFTIIVRPSAGYFTANGSALLFGVSDLLTSRLEVWLRLHNDYWNISATFVTSELCTMTQCTVLIDTSRRVLQVFLEPNPDYYIPVDTVYPITLRAAYVASRSAPLNPTNQRYLAYITPGVLTWAGPALTTQEAVVRAGTAPQIYITMRGDLFTTASDIYASLIRSTTCSVSGSTSSFCARLPYLMQVAMITITDSNRVAQITLQADGGFDAAVPDTVLLALDGRATQSRVAPTNNYSFTIMPSAGTFTFSGLPSDVAAVDFAGGPTARPLRVRMTVTGDRFVNNVSVVVQALISSGITVTGGPGAFSIYQGLSALLTTLITPQSSALSDDCRTLTMTFVPNSDYLSDNDETVNVTIPGAALASGLAATTLGGGPFQFSITATSAEVTLSPLVLYASALRTTGADVFLTIASGGTWEQSYVQVGPNIFQSTMCGSTLRQEPYGCSRYLAALFSQVISQGALINGSSLVFQLQPVAGYDIVFPETITFELTLHWTAAELPPVPARLTLTIEPDPVILYAVVAMEVQPPTSANTTNWDPVTVAASTPTTVDVPSFRSAVAEWLNIPLSLIEVVSNEPELRVGNASATKYLATIGFRIQNVKSPSPYYDDSLATDFLSMGPALPLTSSQLPLLSWRHFRPEATVGYGVVKSSVYYAFSSSQAPPSYIWDYLRSGALPDTSSFTFPLTPLALFGIVAGAVAAVILGVAIRRGIVRSRTQGGLGRSANRTVEEKVAGKGGDVYELTEEQQREDAAVFSGQRGAELSLRGDGEYGKASRHWRGDPRRATTALNKETINRDVPILLYSGQASHSPDKPAGVVLDIDAFLEDNGYKPQQHSRSEDSPEAKRRAHRVTADEARIQKAAVAAGLTATAAKEGDLVKALDPLEDPFHHVVYPVWSQSRPGAFRPPSKFREDTFMDL